MENLFNCEDTCNTVSFPNDIKILIIQLKREVDDLMNKTETKLLLHDGKIAEMCKYIKDNLSNSLRCLIDSMKLSGELDNIISESVFNEIIELKNIVVNVRDFGAYGDGIHDDTMAIQNSINNANGKMIYIPKTDKFYKVGKLTINNPELLKFEGVIETSDVIEIIGDVNNQNRPHIEIYNIKGGLTLKGISTGFIKIGRCNTLNLISDNRLKFIGYNSFYLSDVINLNIETLNDGWVNENIFIGGRITNLNIKGVSSPEDNLFIKPMFENSLINIEKGYRNRFLNCRFEGVNNINLSELTHGNYFEKTFYTTPELMYAKYQDYDINFNDSGDNVLIRETGTKSINLISINKYNNPYNHPIVNDKVEPTGTWSKLFISDVVKLPTNKFGLEFINPSKNVGVEIKFYDSNKNQILSNINALKGSQFAFYEGTYTLGSAEVQKAMAIIDPNKGAKYMSITLTGCGLKMSIEELEVRISHKEDDLIQRFIEGFKTPISL